MPDLKNAEIHWLEDGSPYASRYDDIYFSNQGGPAESEHVFLKGNNLAERWQRLAGSSDVFTLVELGFGTGLNFLLSWRLLQQLDLSGFRLHYLAFEKHPLSRADLQRAVGKWPGLESFGRQLSEVTLITPMASIATASLTT